MFVLGIVLLIVGAGLGSLAFVGARGETTTIPLRAFGFSREVSPLELFVIGAAAALLFCIGWALLAAAMRRRARIRREDREREQLAQVRAQVESQRAEYEGQIESQRADHERQIESQRADHERQIESRRAEYESHLEQSGLRDEDLRRREEVLTEHQRQLEVRDHQTARLEAVYKEQVGPSVADVVTGRARGRVSEGTAEWTRPATPDATDSTDSADTTDNADSTDSADATADTETTQTLPRTDPDRSS